MDINHEVPKIKRVMKNYNFTLGTNTHFIIYNFKNPIKKRKHEKTTYYFFKAHIISKDNHLIPYGKHTIQLPSKRVVLPLYDILLKANKIDDSEITLTIIKNDNFNYDITLHNN
ncbi:hypothetical protein LCGC14_1891270 [marine sediment metagenome]|uniref:Uncharacterized protein n=1 Tax=marine sediment metagenome TaxID=412755 RepID=A0A0F9IXJ7_9ZZZZ